MLKWAKNVADRLTARAIKDQLDRRRLQAEIDAHRLFLLTTFYERRATDGVPRAEALDAEAQALGFEGCRLAVEANVQRQVRSLASVIHAVVEREGSLCSAAASTGVLRQKFRSEHGHCQQTKGLLGQQPAQYAAAVPRRRGLAAAVGAADSPLPLQIQPVVQNAAREMPIAVLHNRHLQLQHVAVQVREATGYSLAVNSSAIWQAGEGLWLHGAAQAGAVVAMMPGVMYPLRHHRQIPGYPRIDLDNAMLASRFDGSIVDSKPWGQGDQGDGHLWPLCRRNAAERCLSLLEGRNPFALGHYANHPGPREAPNVMLAAVDFPALPEEDQWLRGYLPCITYNPHDRTDVANQPGESFQPESTTAAAAEVAGSSAGCLALIALQDLSDEELLLNYRLSPGMSRPDWFRPVDEEEDRRRWA